MKIGQFVSKFPYSQRFSQYSYGGSILAAYYLSKNMANENNEITVFTTSIDSKDHIEKQKNMTVFRYGTKFRLLSTNISFGLLYKPQKHEVDIVHTHFDIPPGPLAGLRYAKKKKVPLIVTYHGDWVESYGGLIRRAGVAFHNRYLVDKLLSHAEIIISPSKCYINNSSFLNRYRNKIVVIPNGINLNEFDIPYQKEECRLKLGLPLNKKILLFFGNLEQYKGPDILIKAIPIIKGVMADTEVIFVGKGVMKDDLINLSRKLGVRKHIKVTGFVKDELKPLYYKAADVFVLPSKMSTESFGIVNLEAMASDLPIVASNIGGIPDVVKDGENGLLVPPGNPELLAEAIVHLLENENIRKKMGENGKKKVEEYLWERIAKKTEKIYMNVLNSKECRNS